MASLRPHQPRHDDWSSTAYFYFDRPANELPPHSPPMEFRTVGLEA